MLVTTRCERLDVVSEDLLRRVDEALQRFLDQAAGEIADIGDDLEPVVTAARSFVLGGGKRLRPAFCYWAARAVGTADSSELVTAAASLELLQACALVHDDVIDRSAFRRGAPATHEQFAALHRDRGWAGDAATFGAAAAILLGDLFLVWSETMLATSGLEPAALCRARPVGAAMRVELMAGQYLDILEPALGGGSVERALRVARFKAAKYTVERPLHLGAAIGDADAASMTALSDYGVPLGEAFQLRDDLLGVFGDPSQTGKPAGDDLREGKRTVLVALAAERATPADRAVLDRDLGDPDLDGAGVDRLRHIVTTSGAAGEVETMIDDRTAAAVKALETVELEPDARTELLALATAATQRVG